MHDLSTALEISVHDTAIVEPGAQVGSGTSVWHYAHVRSGARIGRNCMLGKDTYVAEEASLGNRVRVQNGVNIFNGVTLEDEVFVGPAVVFTNDLFPRATNLIDPDFRPTVVRRGASLGAGSIIVCGVEIGSYAMIGAGAVVINDVPAYACVVGNPAHQIGWSCRCGRSLIAETGDPLRFVCSVCQREYRQHDSALRNDPTGRLIGNVELEAIEHDFHQ